MSTSLSSTLESTQQLRRSSRSSNRCGAVIALVLCFCSRCWCLLATIMCRVVAGDVILQLPVFLVNDLQNTPRDKVAASALHLLSTR
jgi:hypothetical protein